ncbi:MAG: hypothetical protein ABGY75_00350 [Gemmataceae bacterium]
MRVQILTVAAGVTAALFAAGCGNTSPTCGHASGTTNPTTGKANDKSATFNFKGPAITPSLAQGEKKNITLTLDRGNDFRDTVKFSAEAPKGLKVEFPKASVAAGEPNDVIMSVEAAADAAVAEHNIKVTATPAAGAATSLDIKVKVDAKK